MMGVHFTWKNEYSSVVNAAHYLYNHLYNEYHPRIHWGKLTPLLTQEQINTVYGSEMSNLRV